MNNVTSYYYDYAGRRTAIVFPDLSSQSFGYNAMGQLTSITNALGVRKFGYNNQGLQTSVTNAFGVEERIVYDIRDQPTSVTDANGVTFTQTFDYLGRSLTRTAPDSGVEKYLYTARGLVGYTNQLSKVWRYEYDAATRKITETNANTEIIRYTFNSAADLLTLRDGKNQVTTWNYDQYGRVTNKIDQASASILRYQYDANGRLTNRWSAAKGNTAYSYDAVGNLTLVNYPSSYDITTQYDALNRVTNRVDATGTTKYTYHANGQILTEDGPWDYDTVTYGYNNDRLRNSLSLQQPTGYWTNGLRNGVGMGSRLFIVHFTGGDEGGYEGGHGQTVANTENRVLVSYHGPRQCAVKGRRKDARRAEARREVGGVSRAAGRYRKGSGAVFGAAGERPEHPGVERTGGD